ncbi:hypothetical protein LCGC14_2924870, partial [marine sediment metagenome]
SIKRSASALIVLSFPKIGLGYIALDLVNLNFKFLYSLIDSWQKQQPQPTPLKQLL